MQINGSDSGFCKAPNQMVHLDELLEQQKLVRQHMEKQVEQNRIAYEWLVSYIERTMPIKSHYTILLGSLSILAAFATIMKFVDHFLQ